MLEQLLYNNLFSENNLILPKQSVFRPPDLCSYQLLSNAYKILLAFDNGHKVRGVFLDVSKNSDRLWHEGLLFK